MQPTDAPAHAFFPRALGAAPVTSAARVAASAACHVYRDIVAALKTLSSCRDVFPSPPQTSGFVDRMGACLGDPLPSHTRGALGIDSNLLWFGRYRTRYPWSIQADRRRDRRLGSIHSDLVSRLFAAARLLREYAADLLQLQLQAAIRCSDGEDIDGSQGRSHQARNLRDLCNLE